MITAVRAAVLAALLSICGAAVSAPPEPIEDFARMPQIRDVSISPDGSHVAFISSMDDASVLMTFDRSGSGNEFRQVAASEPDRFDLDWCKWANGKRLLCSLVGNFRGKKYAEPPFSRLLAVDADASNLKVLEQAPDKANMVVATTTVANYRPNDGSKQDFTPSGRSTKKGVALYNPEQQAGVIDVTPDENDNVLVQVDDDRDTYPSIFDLNIYTGARGLRVDENPPINNFATDGKGNVRIGWGDTENLNTHYYARLEGERDWRRLTRIKAFTQTDAMRPIAVAPWKNTAYAVGDYQGRDALWAIDLGDKEEPRLLFNHPLVDVGEPLLTADKRLLGIRYDVERPYAFYETETVRALIDRLQKQFPNKFHHIVDSTHDEKTFIVRSSSDVDEGTYYVYDTTKDLLQRLGTAYPELQPESLGRMSNIVYKAADGTEIPGYLTVPTGVRAEKLPLIVLPHDGPIARDTWRFSFLRTFLANRGYAVLQMNYRGSSGYGHKWQLDAHQDWGGVSYSDVTDAARWAVAEGIADPKRICIAGWGFGGYAALLGAARNGDLYRCSISIAGISDLELLRDHAVVHRDAEYRREQVGADREKLRRDSPLKQIDKISIPVLMVHGEKDWQVQSDQSKMMAAALKWNKKPHKAVIIETAGHELNRKSDRVKLLKEIEAFLLEHLGKGVQPDGQQPS